MEWFCLGPPQAPSTVSPVLCILGLQASGSCANIPGMLVLGLGTFLPRAIRDVEKTGGPYGLEFMFCSVIHTSEG